MLSQASTPNFYSDGGVVDGDWFGGKTTWGIRILILLGEAKMEYNIIFQRVFNDIPFIGYYRLEDVPYSGVICNIMYFFLRSAYSPRRGKTPSL